MEARTILCSIVVTVLGLFLQDVAEAQVVAPFGPGGAQGSTLTPAQMQQAMMMRALGGRSRRGVQSGVPQDFGNMGFGQNPIQLTDPAPPTSTRKSSAERRAEARKQRDAQKNAVKEDEKAKKAKGAKGAKNQGGNRARRGSDH